MVCKKCGHELRNGVTVCSKCGTKVEATTEKIQVSYENEDVFVEPPIITESHTFIDEGDFLKKIKEAEKKQKKKEKKEKKVSARKIKKKKEESDANQKSPALWAFTFLLMFIIGTVLGFVIFPNILKNGNDSQIGKKAEKNSFSSDEWINDEFILDGVYYKLNSSYSNFKSHGWKFDLVKYGYEDGFKLKMGEKITTDVDLESVRYNDANVRVGFVNLNPSEKDILDCQIWSITIDNHSSSTPVPFMLPGGVQMGSTINEIVAVYGELEPNQIYRSDSMKYTAYHYTNDYTQYLDLTVYDDGGLQQVSFRHY